MKKSVAIILAVVIVCAVLTVGAVAKSAKSPTQGGTTGSAESGDLLVTPIIEEDSAGESIVSRLEEARGQLEENADDLSALCAGLKDVADIKDFAVIDVVDVIWGDNTQKTVDEKGFIEITFETKLARDSQLHVIFCDMRGGEWKSMDDKAEIQDNGTVKVQVSEMGVFAFLVK